jgi:hypothetical protein
LGGQNRLELLYACEWNISIEQHILSANDIPEKRG